MRSRNFCAHFLTNFFVDLDETSYLFMACFVVVVAVLVVVEACIRIILYDMHSREKTVLR